VSVLERLCERTDRHGTMFARAYRRNQPAATFTGRRRRLPGNWYKARWYRPRRCIPQTVHTLPAHTPHRRAST
jgi:hypothetical protein